MKFISFICLCLLVQACANKSESGNESKSDFNIDSIKMNVDLYNQTYGDDRFTRNDPAFYADKYCTDAVVMPAQHPSVKGRDSISAYFFDGGKNKNLVILVTATGYYGNKEYVIEEGVYNFPDSTGGSYDKGKYIAVWKPEDNKWKLYREIWNTDIAPTPNK